MWNVSLAIACPTFVSARCRPMLHQIKLHVSSNAVQRGSREHKTASSMFDLSMVHIGQTFIFWCPVDYYCLLVNSASIWSVHQRPMQSGDRTNSHRTQTCLSDAVPPSSHATEQAAWASAVLKPWDAKSIFLMHRPSCPIHCRELLFFFTSSLVQNC
jgi:hypothetical protein